MKIKAAVTNEVDAKFSMEELDMQEPGFGQVRVKIHSCGVCHTDEVVRKGFVPTPMPIVLGHETSGIVDAVGPGVKGFAVGDHVGASFASCGQCENCLEGHPYGCMVFNELNFGGTTNDGGTVLSKGNTTVYSFFGQAGFATYAIMDTRNLFNAPKDVDLGLIGPLGCGIQTGAGAVLNRLKPKPASSIAIFGCGTVGLSAVMAAKIAGCTTIIAVDVNPMKLDFAMEVGATHTVNVTEVEDTAKAIKDLVKGGVHYSIDTTGRGESVRKAILCTRFRGVTVVLGATGDMTINVQADLMGDGKSLLGVVEGDSVPQVFIPALLEYYKRGQFPIDKMMTYYTFEDIQKAFDEAHKNVKSVLVM